MVRHEDTDPPVGMAYYRVTVTPYGTQTGHSRTRQSSPARETGASPDEAYPSHSGIASRSTATTAFARCMPPRWVTSGWRAPPVVRATTR